MSSSKIAILENIVINAGVHAVHEQSDPIMFRGSFQHGCPRLHQLGPWAASNCYCMHIWSRACKLKDAWMNAGAVIYNLTSHIRHAHQHQRSFEMD